MVRPVPRILAAILGLAISMFSAVAAPAGLATASPMQAGKATPSQELDWLLVRGAEDQYGALTLDKIGEIYLRGHSWKVVTADAIPTDYSGSLFLLGTPSGNPQLAEILEPIGLKADSGGAIWRGAPLPSGVGLIARGTSEKGIAFTAFTGVDARSVYSCFTVSTSVTGGSGHELIRNRQRISWQDLKRVAGPGGRPQFADQLQVHRADQILWQHLPAGNADAVYAAAKKLAGFQWEYQRIWSGSGPQPNDLYAYLQWLASQPESLAQTRNQYADVDLTSELAKVYSQCRTELGKSKFIAPQVTILVATAADTNAVTSGLDPITGRPRILINLAAIENLESLRLIAAHEFVHTFQLRADGTLERDLLWLEGVASCISQEMMPDTPDHVALMWSQQQLKTARQYHSLAVKEFLAAHQAGGNRLKSWFLKGRAPERNNALPDRMGYYLGWYAAKQWLTADDSRRPADLLQSTPQQLLETLKQ